VSFGEACRLHGVDLDGFLEKLAEAKSRLGSQP
jgi:hypothetical protein